MDDLESLKELAQAALKVAPGNWDIDTCRDVDAGDYAEVTYERFGKVRRVVDTFNADHLFTPEDRIALCAYIAAANPDALLNLIARVRELEANQRTPGFIEKCPECGCQEDLNLANPRLHERCRIEDCPSP